MFSSIFGKKTVSSPTLTHVTIEGIPISITGMEATFPGTNIVVKKGAVAYPADKGNYLAKVLGHLAEIKRSAPGLALFQALALTGKKQNVIYGGPNVNQCAGSPMGYYKLRKFHAIQPPVDFARELRETIERSGKGKPWIAAKLAATNLPHWNGHATPLFTAAPPAIPGRAVNPLAMGAGGGAIVEKINTWCSGAAHPSNSEMDILALVLEPWMTPGPGVGSRINYDPDKFVANGHARPPWVALFHELMHGYYNALGTQMGVEESSDENLGGRLFELMAVGLPPFHTRALSENVYRGASGTALRIAYP